MLQRYEVLMLTVPEITQDELKNLETHLDDLVRKAKGVTISFEKWGKFKLAYPVKKKDYGIYILIRFEVPKASSIIEDMKSYFTIKVHDIMMRSMISCLDSDQSLIYQRPKSLEESPTSRDVRAFLRENKMEGLLSSVGTQAQQGKSEQSAVPKAQDKSDANK